MRSWVLARTSTLCGGCGVIVRKGSPIQSITAIGLKRALSRCQACAEGTVPEVIGEARSFDHDFSGPVVLPQPVYGFTSISRLARDVKMRQTGEEG